MGESYLYNFPFLIAIALSLFGAYVLYVRYQHHKYLQSFIEKYPDPDVVLQNHDIALDIFGDMFNRDFVFSTRMASSVANFKALSINSISKTIASTRKTLDDTNHRLKKTAVDICELIEPTSRIKEAIAQGRTLDEKQIDKQLQRRNNSVQRLNTIHSKYRIRNEDFLYILYIFAVGIVDWVSMSEGREIDIREKNAVLRVWYEIGTLMNVKDIPDTLQEWGDNMHEYGKKNSPYHARNWEATDASIKYLTQDMPWFLRNAVYFFLPCALNDYECVSFGIPKASPFKQTIFKMALRLRWCYMRYLCLPRKTLKVDTSFDFDTGAHFMRIDQLRSNGLYKKNYQDQKHSVQDFVPDLSYLHSLLVKD